MKLGVSYNHQIRLCKWFYGCPQVQAAFDYVLQQPDELSLGRSGVVKVFQKMPDGEWPVLNWLRAFIFDKLLKISGIITYYSVAIIIQMFHTKTL